MERDVCLVDVIGMNPRNVHAVEQDGLAVLDFVDKDIRPFSVVYDSCLDMFKKSDGIEKRCIDGLFKIDGDNVVRCYAGLEQMLSEKIEEKKTLTASPKARHNLDETIVFCRNKLLQVQIALDDHKTSVYKKLTFVDFLKAEIVYHICGMKATPRVRFLDIDRKIKSGFGDCGVFARKAA